jgi:hypothetical protein
MLTVRVEDCGLAFVKFIVEAEKLQEAVAGTPLHVSKIEPRLGSVGETVTENVELFPCITVIEDGFTARAKSGGGGTGVGTPGDS